MGRPRLPRPNNKSRFLTVLIPLFEENNRLKGYSAELRCLVSKWYRDGLTTTYINSLLGFDDSCYAVYEILRQEGVSIRHPGRPGRIHSLNESFFDHLNHPDKWYTLGLIATDGTIHRRGGFVLSLQNQDRNVLEKIKASMEYTGPVHNGRWGQSHLCIYSKRIGNRLEELGLHPRKTFTVEPASGSTLELGHYWRGCVDGDGSISDGTRWGARISFCGNRQMVEGFRRYVEENVGQSPSFLKHGNIWISDVRKKEHLCQMVRAFYYDHDVICIDRKRVAARTILSRGGSSLRLGTKKGPKFFVPTEGEFLRVGRNQFGQFFQRCSR